VSADDHHSAYLAKTVAALTPAGRERVDEILDQLGEAAGGRDELARFATDRKAEADLGRTEITSEPDPGQMLTSDELNDLTASFAWIRDQEPLDDVGDWANAVVALLTDELHAARTGAR